MELQRTGFFWDLVHKGKLYKNNKLKIFVPFVKCDTEDADLLCGKFEVRTRTVKHICGYCHCPTLKADDPRVKHKKKTPEDIQKLVDKGDIEGLKAMSQQCIDNAWYEVVFHKANKQGIHGACPSEMLHAILLGTFNYARESFFDHMGKSSELAEDINFKAHGERIAAMRGATISTSYYTTCNIKRTIPRLPAIIKRYGY